jgi:hypothetical protein
MCRTLAGGYIDHRRRSAFVRRAQLESDSGGIHHHRRLATAEHSRTLDGPGSLWRRHANAYANTASSDADPNSNSYPAAAHTNSDSYWRRWLMRSGLECHHDLFRAGHNSEQKWRELSERLLDTR